MALPSVGGPHVPGGQQSKGRGVLSLLTADLGRQHPPVLGLRLGLMRLASLVLRPSASHLAIQSTSVAIILNINSRQLHSF